MRAILSVFAISLVVACGNKAEQAPPASPATNTSAPAGTEAKGHGAEGHHEGGGHHEDHGAMSPAIKEFHETIKPIWHSKEGTERVTKACAGQADLSAKAAAVGDAELTANVEAVKTACATPDKKDVETKLSAVHDRFHKLAEKK